MYVYVYIYVYIEREKDRYISRRHQTCHFQKRAPSVPAEGPAKELDLARHCELPLRALQAQKWHVHLSRTFCAA